MTSFRFDLEWAGAIWALGGEERLQVYDALTRFAFQCEEPEGLGPRAKLVFAMMRRKLIEREYERKRKARSRKRRGE